MITNFLYNDIVLYCRGWYKRNSIIEDLSYLFSKIYGWAPTTENEVALMMLKVIDKLYEELEIKFSMSSGYYSLFNEAYRNMKIYDYSIDMGIIYACKDILLNLPKDKIKLNCPHFGKNEHFRLGMLFGEYPISQTYAEMNRIAQKNLGI